MAPLLERWHGVLVDRLRGGDMLVAEDPADHLGRDAGLEAQRGEGVAEVMEPDRRERLPASGSAGSPSRDRGVVHLRGRRRACDPGEREPRESRAGADGAPSGSWLSPRRGHRSPAAVGLRLAEPEWRPLRPLGECPRDVETPRPEVNPRPSHGQKFSAPHPGGCRQAPQGVQRVVAELAQEGGKLRVGPGLHLPVDGRQLMCSSRWIRRQEPSSTASSRAFLRIMCTLCTALGASGPSPRRRPSFLRSA